MLEDLEPRRTPAPKPRQHPNQNWESQHLSTLKNIHPQPLRQPRIGGNTVDPSRVVDPRTRLALDLEPIVDKKLLRIPSFKSAYETGQVTTIAKLRQKEHGLDKPPLNSTKALEKELDSLRKQDFVAAKKSLPEKTVVNVSKLRNVAANVRRKQIL